jgi:thioredoxin reductase/bacterioferritin-associated ferredoxin
MKRGHFEVAVIGAGPAGMAAATASASLGLATVVLDEAASPGGQIHRAIRLAPPSRRALLGHAYAEGVARVERFVSSGADYRPATSVWAVERGSDGSFVIGVADSDPLRTRALIVATGAIERPMPIPGWTLPGVMAAGGAQTLLKSAGLRPAGRVVLAGCGPLLWLVAGQLLDSGANIDSVLETTPRGRLAQVLRHAPGFVTSGYFARGLELSRNVRRRTRVVEYVEAIEAAGNDRLERVRYAQDGTWQEQPADLLLLSQGVVPNVQLPSALGCDLTWNDRQACFEPVVDAWGGTPLPNLFVEGDGEGIAGAAAAEARGELAGLAVANALGRIDASRRDREAVRPRRALGRVLRGRAFLDALYRPADAFRLPGGATLVCRCEEVSAGAIVEAIEGGATTPGEVKSATRCGMGPCQGRFCSLTLVELCARAAGTSPADSGHPRSRLPLQPVALQDVARWPVTPEAEAAVIRSPK